MSRIVIVILIQHRHKPIDSINLLDSWILFDDAVLLNTRQNDE
jgi:hypothetical protein